MEKIEKSQKDGDGSAAGKGMVEQFVAAKEDKRGFQIHVILSLVQAIRGNHSLSWKVDFNFFFSKS